ncbi:hypothetical protein [Flavobacterium ajazii]|uniref:hypothetical protein n=1 Tax=Flavobacterium ajazii TaxID=2692318 RepID=UPI0013D4E451|nr:hypothetical protein [Flavobacterium ajazii]
MRINYFTKKYTYLDQNLKVNMNSQKFEAFKKKYNFSRTDTARDSLSVALMAEFNNWDQARIAELRISYTWVRLGYHLLLNEFETKKIGKEFNIKYPYLLKEMISRNNTQKVKNIISNLKKRIEKLDSITDLSKMNADQLMRKALEINPVRKKKYKEGSRHKH